MGTSGTGASYGDTSALSVDQVTRLFHQAGFRGEDLVTIVGISKRESGWDPGALNPNSSSKDLSFGLMQVNMHGELGPARRQQFGLSSNADLYDPMTNARVAFQMYQANGFYDWGPYKGMEPTYNVSPEVLAQARDAATRLGLFDGSAPAPGMEMSQVVTPNLWEADSEVTGPLGTRPTQGASPGVTGSLGTQLGSLQSPANLGSTGLPTYPEPITPDEGQVFQDTPTTTDQPPPGSALSQGGIVFPVPGGRVAQGLGAPRDGGRRKHQGVDIMADFGTPIYATTSGTLVYAQDRGGNPGWAVSIQDSAGNTHRYMHLDPSSRALWDDSGLVAGRPVTAGTIIGYVGNTGNAKGGSPHLHYSINEGGGPKLVDPVAYLDSSAQPGLVPVGASQPPPSRSYLWQA